jgi:uncharacterized protein
MEHVSGLWRMRPVRNAVLARRPWRIVGKHVERLPRHAGSIQRGVVFALARRAGRRLPRRRGGRRARVRELPHPAGALHPLAGLFSRPEHALFGQSYVGRVLVCNTAKGGVATAWMLHEMSSRGMAPAALLFNRANTILAQGAALADLALCDRFVDGDVTTLIRTGDRVTVDPGLGRVVVEREG